MNLTIQRLKAELSDIIKKGSSPEDIRAFFKPKDDLDDLVVKCVMWGHYFWPK